MKTIVTSFIVCLSVVLPRSVFPQGSAAPNELKDHLQMKLDSLYETWKVPGVTLAAVLPEGQVLRLAAGTADSIGMIPMSPSHRMMSGSNGKTLFIASILSLYEDELFDLNDPVVQYLGEEEWFSGIPNSSSITIRMLMNHTSGIEEYYTIGDFMERVKENPDRVWQPEEILAYIMGREPLFPAGEKWGYADTNYILLGYLIEKLTGMDLYELVQQKVIGPNQLNQTSPSTSRFLSGLAVGYSADFSPFPFHGAMVRRDSLVFNPQFEWTGGGFVSNVEDLAKWAKGFYQSNQLSEQTHQEIRKGIAAYTGKEHFYGLGVQIRPTQNFGLSYGHSGWFPGYLTDAIYLPQLDLALSIQFNSDDGRLLGRTPYDILVEFAESIVKSSK